MLTKERIGQVVASVARSKNDTGSTEVQVALLTERISQISGHLQKFPKDHHSRRGLLKLVGQRKTFIKYLLRTDKKKHDAVVKRIQSLKA